jgi:LuxR family maltose regulon positive regulatory protein
VSSEVLTTKLFIPQARSALVPRPRLAARLNEAAHFPLTLICAPAGFGKTTLLSAWIPNSDHRVAWLSLDEGDNDPARFWSHVIAALQRLWPGLGESARILLQSPQPPPMDAILTSLLNEVAAFDCDAALVLDDYHVIEAQPVHDAFAFLLDHLPSQFHLILTSRSDPPLPLARLRARGQMKTLRADDLRFTREEAAMFLEQVMGLHLSAADVAALETCTEGWIAGLQLAALSMQGQADIPGFISAFTGSNRYIVDYLMDEVLDRRPTDTLNFLLQTAILDRLSEPLCDAVTGGGGSQALLEQLERLNLFIVPLDEERKWYRYHHLFADVLRNRLRQTQPALMPELHRRASAWYEQHGQMAEAISHALASSDSARAASLVEQSTWSLLGCGEVTTLQRWLDALPVEVVSARPDLGLAYAWLFSITNRLDALATRLQDLERDGERPADGSLTQVQLNQVAALRAHLAIEGNDFRRALTLCRMALAGIPESNLHMRGLVSYFLGFAEHMSGDTMTAARTFAETSALGQATGNVLLVAHGLNYLAAMQEAQGRLRQAAETYRQAVRLSSDSRGRPLVVACVPFDSLGKLLREWNELDESERLLRESIALAHLGDNHGEEINANMSLALTLQAKRDEAGAQGALEAARQIAHQTHHEEFLKKVNATEARLRLIQGRVDSASRWAVESGLHADDRLDYPDQMEYATLARVLIALGRERSGEQHLVQARRLLDWQLQVAQSAGRAGHVIEIRMLQAMALPAKDDFPGARASLESALTLAEPEGYVRLFVDEGEPMKALLRRLEIRDSRLRVYRDRLVAAFAGHTTVESTTPSIVNRQSSVENLFEPLNQRELEVLHCIGDGLSNREIAARFFVAPSTVKWYINNLYGKLGVSSRTQALARARALGLM